MFSIIFLLFCCFYLGGNFSWWLLRHSSGPDWWKLVKISSPHVTSCKNMSLVSCCLNRGQDGLREPQLEHIGPVFFPVLSCTIILGKSTTLGQRNYNINTHYLSFPLSSFPCSRDSHTVKVDSATLVYCTRRPGLFFPPISWARLLPLYEPRFTTVLNKISVLHMLPRPHFD